MELERSDVQDPEGENKVMVILGGFGVVKDPFLWRILNLVFLSCVFAMYVFLYAMGIFTLIEVAQDKLVVVKLFHFLCVLSAIIRMLVARRSTRSELDTALGFLKDGMYSYEGEEEGYTEIKRRRVSQLRQMHSHLFRICTWTALFSSGIMPLTNVLLGKDEGPQDLNPYLPLPIYMPFNTRIIPNYILALAINVAYHLAVYFGAIYCLMIFYTSFAMQLVAQLEILEYSLKNIEQRARWKLESKGLCNSGKPHYNQEMDDFKRCMCSCLRENLIHHHAILRYTKATSGYMEALNFLVVGLYSIMLASCVVAVVKNSGLDMEVMGQVVMESLCIFLLCMAGQFIQDKSVEINASLYGTPWQDCSEDFKSLLRMMLMNTNIPIKLKTPVFNVDITLATFGDLISAGYKLTTVLY